MPVFRSLRGKVRFIAREFIRELLNEFHMGPVQLQICVVAPIIIGDHMPISVHFVLYHPVVHRGTYAQALFKHRLAHAMVIYEILSAGSSTLRGQASRDSDFIRCHRLNLDVIGQEYIFCSKQW